MKKLIKLGILPLLALILVGCEQAVIDRFTKQKESLTLSDMNTCIQSLNNDLEVSITYNTQQCVKLQRNPNDAYLRAFKHKERDLVAYQLFFISHRDEWTNPYLLNYRFGEELVSVSADKIDSDVSCYSTTCRHMESFGFDIREDYLADLSAKYNDTGNVLITMRVQNKSAPNFDFLISSAELVGLYRRVSGSK